MNRRRSLAVVAVGGAAVLALTGCRAALPPTAPAIPADFSINKIADQTGAAFVVTGELGGGKKNKEIVTTSFNFVFPGGPPIPVAGSVEQYSKTSSGWTKSTIVPTSAGIIGPNEPQIVDVNRDGRNDVIVPAGYFFSQAFNLNTGSLTWWENNGDGSYTRHDIIGGLKGSYHGVAFVDFDGDNKKDIITTFEDGGFPAYPFAGPPIAPNVRTEFFKGDGNGNFEAPVKVADGGGTFPVVFDINADGKLDIATAQYWGVKTFPIGSPPALPGKTISNESAVWFEQGSDGVAGLSSADFTKHVIATGLGESFALIPVDNIDGNGKYGAILTNHTNPTAVPGSAAPQAFRLTPGADVTQPWNVESIASFTLNATQTGQAAPGKASDGDLDGDGDIDLALSGDADWGMYWLERAADGSWVKHNIADEYGVPGTNWGQGSATIADLDSNGTNEIVFGSYNANGIFVVEREPGTGGKIPATPRVPDLLLRY